MVRLIYRLARLTMRYILHMRVLAQTTKKHNLCMCKMCFVDAFCVYLYHSLSEKTFLFCNHPHANYEQAVYSNFYPISKPYIFCQPLDDNNSVHSEY